MGRCTPCPGGSFQAQSGQTACEACTSGRYCTEASAAPLPCAGGTHQNASLTVMTNADDCVVCPVGTFCSVGSVEPTSCAPGTYNDQRNASRCVECAAGFFQALAGATACFTCSVGGYCQRGATSPQLCPGGTSSNRTGLVSQRGCLPVLAGFWSPAGSALPLDCPPSGFLCPGATADRVNTPPGSLPIQLPTGGVSIERQVEREVLQLHTTLTLYTDVDSIDESALKQRLARLYSVHVEDISMSISGGSVVVRISLTAATRDAAAQLHRALNVTSDSELSLALGINTTHEAGILIDTLNITRTEIVQEACPPGFWCSAGYTYPCEAGSFNPVASADSASACTYCSPGKYNPFQGQSSEASCRPCPEGTANPKSGGAGMDACASCPVGTYAGTNGSDACQPCSPGTYSGQRAATACITCEPGYYCTAETPIMCSQNTYNPNPGAYLSTNCTSCPGRFTSTLGLEGRTSIDDCACSRTFFLAPPTMNLTGMEDECEERCCTCPIGTDCPGGVMLEHLPVVRGYYRRSPDQIDVRRCPDASANCPPGESICADSTSACRGGRNATNATSEMCHAGLTGIFCRACVQPFEFFVHAEQGADAHCEPCENAVSSSFWIAIAGLIGVGFVIALVFAGLAYYYRHHVPDDDVGVPDGRRSWRRQKDERADVYLRRVVKHVWELLIVTYSVPNKIKILIASYQIMTKIEDVYEVQLPPAVRALLQQLRIVVSFGIEGYPLACVGADGYEKRLLLWTFTPLVLSLLAVLAVLVDLRVRRGIKRFTASLIFQNAMPLVLRLAFILYPIVTNVAFEAFSCFGFEDGRSWLIADVNVECNTDQHAKVTTLAGIAIAIYPVGLLLLNASILYCARDAIRTNRETPLSNAAHFLYAEYATRFFWWELMEMGRRFLLVGLYVIWPFRQGSIMQVAFANLTAIIFLVLQLQAMPHRIMFDNYLAIACSLSLTVMLLCTIFYKYVSLTELPGIRDRMSLELKNDYEVQGVLLSTIFIVCVFGGLVFSAVITAEQMREERVRQQREAREAKARRLRWTKDDTEVILSKPVIPDCKPTRFAPTTKMGAISKRFHIFLSHVWGTGQDQMRIVKTRLKMMLPDVVPFLDVDDLTEGKGAEYVDASSVTLIFVSDGYFNSENCMREFLRAVVTGKPMVTLMESEAKKGGLTQNRVLQQLCEAATSCDKNGKAYPSKYAMWGLANEMTAWGYEMPSAGVLHASLYNHEPIEWNRVGAFQDVSLRLIAESMLPKGHPQTYLQGELTITSFKLTLPKPKGGKEFHIYCSPSNVGSAELISEVSKALSLNIKVTRSISDLGKCERMLVYLNELTWTSGETTARFANEVVHAMDQNMPLLLCHEMPGVGGQAGRHGCEFDLFFNNEQGATPLELLRMDIYSQIATPLKGGAWRDVSIVMVAQALAKPLQVMQAKPPKERVSRLTSEVPPDTCDVPLEVSSDSGDATTLSSRLPPATAFGPQKAASVPVNDTKPQHSHRVPTLSVPSVGRSGRIDQWSKVPVVESPPSARLTKLGPRQTGSRQKLVWIQKHELAAFCLLPIEFLEAGSSTLPPLAIDVLAKVAHELLQQPSIKLHVAGHVHDGEDSKLASKRAQVVGGVLMALGVLPLRLRARGYGATVRLSHKAQAALRLKSQRRVTLHALSEVCTHTPVEFEPASTELSDAAQTLLSELVVLLENQPKIRLTVEAHTDAAENAELAMARSMCVVRFLHERGVQEGRLVPQGFGAFFPCGDTATNEGRKRNRRVEFLVIPDVSTASANAAAATAHAAALALPAPHICPHTPSSAPSHEEGANKVGRASSVQTVQQGGVAPPVDHDHRSLSRERQQFHQAAVDEVYEGTLMDSPGLVTLEEEPTAPETAPAPPPETASAPETAPAPDSASAPAHVAGGRPPSRKVSDGAVDRFTMASSDELASAEDYDA